MLTIDHAHEIECPSRRAVQDALEGDLALHVAATAPEHVFIHAGVVGWQGRALLLPGRTLTGKSTLVAALLRAGATYYSDEYAVVDSEGLVHAYPRRMSLRRQRGLPRRIQPRLYGKRPLEVGWVIGTRYEPTRRMLERESLSAGRTALLLIDNAVAARSESKRVLSAVRRVSSAAVGSFVVRGDARSTAKELLLLLEHRGKIARERGDQHL